MLPLTTAEKKKLKFEPKAAITVQAPQQRNETIQTQAKPIAAAAPKPDTAPPATNAPRTEAKPAMGKSTKLLRLDLLNSMEEEEMAKVAGEVEVVYTGEKMPLSTESVIEVWKQYTAQIADEKKGLKISFGSYTPQLNESNIEVRVQSQIHKEQIEAVMPALQSFFEQRFSSPFSIQIIFDKEVSTVAKPYTPKERFDRLVQKNPLLKKMQQELGLELDYD